MVRDQTDRSEGWVLKLLKNPRRSGRFEREVRALTRISSPHIPPIVDFSLEKPAFHVAPYVGVDLRQGPPAATRPSQALATFRQVVVAARDAHAAGIIHRDIKPDNVVISGDGTVYLVDFGICADSDAHGLVLTTTDEGFGNRSFAAPECDAGSQDAATDRSDVYSLGKLLFWLSSDHELMVRERFDSNKIRLRDVHARRYVAALIYSTVREDPSQRLSTPDLLNRIEWTLRKLGEHATLRRGGVDVIYDSFGPESEVYRGGSRSATTPPRGNPPAHHQVAQEFSTGDEATTLARIDIALQARAGTGRSSVAIHADDGGRPSKIVLATWPILARDGAEVDVYELHPLDVVHLEPSAPYWVVLSAADSGAEIAWVSGALNLRPQPAVFAERDLPDEWRRAESRSGPGHAMRVLVRK